MRPLLIALLSLSFIAPSAQADWGRHGWGGHHERRGGSWIAPAVIVSAGMAAAYALSQPRPVYVAPRPVYVEAPPAPPPNVWFYCASSMQYYPYTQVCPEGWQAVPAGY